MSEIRKRVSHGAEFKSKVAMEALKETRTINEIAQEYGVHPKLVRDWKAEAQEQIKTAFEIKRGKKKVNELPETERLYSEIGKLKMSLDWLQKKSGLSVVR